MTRLLLGALLLFAASAVAQVSNPVAGPQQPASPGFNMPTISTFHYEVAVEDGPNGRQIFGLSQGGCLIGPMVFWDTKGNEVLRLEAGDKLGSGCP